MSNQTSHYTWTKRKTKSEALPASLAVKSRHTNGQWPMAYGLWCRLTTRPFATDASPLALLRGIGQTPDSSFRVPAPFLLSTLWLGLRLACVDGRADVFRQVLPDVAVVVLEVVGPQVPKFSTDVGTRLFLSQQCVNCPFDGHCTGTVVHCVRTA